LSDESQNLDSHEPAEGSPMMVGAESDSAQQARALATSRPNRKPSSIRLWRLASKELRETLRDRRTIVTLILMPLLVYPILSLLFQNFLISNASKFGSDDKPVVLRILFQSNKSEAETAMVLKRVGLLSMKNQGMTLPGFEDGLEDDETAPLIPVEIDGTTYAPFFEHSWKFNKSQDTEAIIESLEFNEVDVAVRFDLDDRSSKSFGEATVFARDDYASKQSAKYLRRQIDAFNQAMLEQAFIRRGMKYEPAISITESPLVKADQDDGGNRLAGLIPLILVLMTITGAVYPAIDLTAGERERGTLETLMAAPVPRMGILLAKFIAVFTVAVLTAILNVVGMVTVIWVFQLEELLLGEGGFTFAIVSKVFFLMILFAAFFSALLLAVTSFARSFKEAQASLIPIILLSMGPGLLAMSPTLKLNGIMSVTPMVNILLLARDVILGQNEMTPSVIAIASTILYALFAIFVAAKTFGDDKILYSQSGSFREMFLRPRETSSFVPLMPAMFCLVLLFPVNLVAIGFLGRAAKMLEGNFAVVCALMATFTIISFFVLPSIIAKFQKVNFKSAFGLQGTSIVYFLAAILLGLSLWPIVMSIVEGWYFVYEIVAGTDAATQRHEKLVELSGQQVSKFREVSPIIVALCFSIVPAFCEEWFFRGMLLRSMLRHWTAGKSIIVSALMFGLFHVLSNSAISLDRFIPTMLVGLLLGYLCYKSDSIVPGVLLHSLHNGIVAFLGYYQPALSKLAWFPGEDDPMPMAWTAIAIVVALAATGLIAMSRKKELPLAL
jgi:membrane protease YdiL (CAAX protease family)/ABC-type Na+ efflux pump permease subunit